MSDKESGGMDKTLEKHLDSDGRNCEEHEKRLGRDYEPMHRGKMKGRGKKMRRGMMARRGY